MKNLERFKKRLMKKHLLESLFVGVSSALAAAALGLCISYLTNPSVSLFVSLASGLTVGLAAGYHYYKKKMPTERDVAHILDKQFGLKEKVTTMVALQEQEDVFAKYQRKDAMEEVERQDEKTLVVRLSSWAIPTLISAALLFGSSFLTPKNLLKSKTPLDPDPSVVIIDESNTTSSETILIPGLDSESDELQEIIDELIKDIKDGDWDGILDDLEKIADELEDLDEGKQRDTTEKLVDSAENAIDEGTPLTEEQQEELKRLLDNLEEALIPAADPNASNPLEPSEGMDSPSEIIREWLEEQTQTPLPNPGPGDGDNQIPGGGDVQTPGDGDGGRGQETEIHTDTIYTGNGEVEYHEVINEMQGEAVEDARKSGDDEAEEATGDYFEELYGDITGEGK